MCGGVPIVNTRLVGPIWKDNSRLENALFFSYRNRNFPRVDDKMKQRGLLGILRLFF